jgi:adenylate cyclase class 2
MSQATQETEIKLAVKDARSARRLLREAGFVVSRPRVFEVNTVLDTLELGLRASSRLLRIRQAGRVATITFKGVPETGKHKSREELELEISNAAAMMSIMKRLGYHRMFRYEKYRTEFRQPRRAGVAMLDETPVGVYLELEGTPHWIDRTARRLGFQESDYITASYGRVYLDWCAANGCKPGDMTFGEVHLPSEATAPSRSRLRSELQLHQSEPRP